MDAEQIIASASSSLQQGRLGEAARLCQELLSHEPANVDALHLLSVVRARHGDTPGAVELLRQALAAEPDEAAFHHDLACLLEQLGQHGEAESELRLALECDPEDAIVPRRLSRLLLRRGALMEARGVLQVAMQRLADVAELRVDLASIDLALFEHFRDGDQHGLATLAIRQAVALLRKAGQANEAAALERRLSELHEDTVGRTSKWCAAADTWRATIAADAALRQRIEQEPGGALAQLTAGIDAIERECRADDGLAQMRRATTIEPNWLDAWSVLGATLEMLGHWNEAFDAIERTAELAPSDFTAQIRAALSWQHDRRPDRVQRGRDRLIRALAAGPVAAGQWNDLGNAAMQLLEIGRAAGFYQRAMALDPRAAALEWNFAQCCLLLGDFERGWPAFERRLEALPNLRHSSREPRWRGEDVAGKTVLLHAESGFGDSIHFVRYAPLLRERGARVVVECPPPLVPLLARVPGVAQVITSGEALPAVDFHIAMPSLPAAFKTTLASIPNRLPYLSVDPAASERWRQRVAALSGFKVGIVWAGSQRRGSGEDERGRSLDRLRPLAAVPGVVLLSLQVGEEARQLYGAGFSVIDWTKELCDFAETAALVQQLDLIITVDTSVAHLAGALAKNVWVMLPAAPDFRWMLDRSDSPWYPTVRLYRQQLGGSWDEVVARIARDLAEAVRSRQEKIA